MTAPPGLTAEHDSTTALDQRQGRTQDLAKRARRLADETGLRISQNRIQRLVRRYEAEGRADIDFRSWVIAHADPTGETAVSNVLAERGW